MLAASRHCSRGNITVFSPLKKDGPSTWVALRLFDDPVFQHPFPHRGQFRKILFFVEDDGIDVENVRVVIHVGELAPDHGVFLFFDMNFERIAVWLPAGASGDEDFVHVLPLVVQHVVQDLRFERTEILVPRPVSDFFDEVLAIDQEAGNEKRAPEVVVLRAVGERAGAKFQMVHEKVLLRGKKFILIMLW